MVEEMNKCMDNSHGDFSVWISRFEDCSIENYYCKKCGEIIRQKLIID